MKQLYKKIDQRFLNPSQQLDEQILSELKPMLGEIKESIISGWRSEVSKRTKTQIKLYICSEQLLLIDEANKAWYSLNNKTVKPEHHVAIYLLTSFYEDLLLHLRTCYTTCFNFDLPVNLNRRVQFIQVRKADFSVLRTEFQIQHPSLPFPDQLEQIFVSDQPDDGPSFKQVLYLEKAFHFFKEKLLTNVETKLDIVFLLVQCNLNHPAAITFCTSVITESTAGTKMSAKLTSIYSLEKKLAQVFPFIGLAYQQDSPELKAILTAHLSAEIQYIKKLERTFPNPAEPVPTPSLKVSLTAKQLAFFIHLQTECGLITEEKPKIIQQHLARHYSTTEQDNISVNGLKNISDANDLADIKKVIKKLSEMLALAQDSY